MIHRLATGATLHSLNNLLSVISLLCQLGGSREEYVEAVRNFLKKLKEPHRE